MKKLDDLTVSVTTDQKYAPTFVLNVLGSWPASVVDKLLLSHQQGNDFGNAWLKTNEAGSGGYKLVKWAAGDSVVLQRFDGYRLPLAMKRIVLRHVPEAASQRLLLENGDVDAARDLGPDDLASVVKSGKAKVSASPQALLLSRPEHEEPDARETGGTGSAEMAGRLCGHQGNVVKTTYKVHQTFLPEGFLGTLNANPYKLDVARRGAAREAGVPNGFR